MLVDLEATQMNAVHSIEKRVYLWFDEFIVIFELFDDHFNLIHFFQSVFLHLENLESHSIYNFLTWINT